LLLLLLLLLLWWWWWRWWWSSLRRYLEPFALYHPKGTAGIGPSRVLVEYCKSLKGKNVIDPEHIRGLLMGMHVADSGTFVMGRDRVG
jgi:hypothetical protein